MFPFCQRTLSASKPKPYGYPAEPRNLGEHIRKRRMDLGLSQRKLAKMLKINLRSVRKWEHGKASPNVRMLPRVIDFLEYEPWDAAATLGEQVKHRRQAFGLTQEETASALGVDPRILRRWEAGREEPREQNLQDIEKFLNRHPRS